MSLIPKEKIDFWMKYNKNVMLIGDHGVGKTGIILQAWREAGLRFLYFSSATMDPWVDLVGIPREKSSEVKRADGTTERVDYIELVPPKQLALDEVDAIFFDEYNRAPEKVRNATMQFIQFKEVNGRKYNNLKMIWVAINPPETGKYDVQELDPAQQDRFHVSYRVDNRPCNEYFAKKYGDEGAKFINWWNKLPVDIKKKVSPRRLDYAAEIFFQGGDMSDSLPAGTNTSELVNILSFGTVEARFARLKNSPHTTQEDIRAFISNDNNFQHLKGTFHSNTPEGKECLQFFLKHIEPERALSMLQEDVYMYDRFFENAGSAPELIETLKAQAEKKDIMPDLFVCGIVTNFGLQKLGKRVRSADGQAEIFAAIQKDLQAGGTDNPNKVYSAAYALTNAHQWPAVKKSKEYAALKEVVETGFDKHPELRKYFAL